MDPRPGAGEPKAQPTISRVLADGTLIELVYDSARRTTALAVRRPDGHVALESAVTLESGEQLVPYGPRNSLIAAEAVLLPSAVRPPTDKPALLDAVRAFLSRYVDLSPLFLEIAAHYVLLSWIYDAFSDIPYLRFRGEYGTGKTRALLTIGHLCYKPVFASGASTVSPIFHILDVFQGTLVLDEADLRFSDATADLIKVLNNGTMRGLPVLRTMTTRERELNPRAFRVFGPKLVGMRGGFSDPALESRFLTEETGGRALRNGVPVQLPAAFKVEALTLRNQLLAFRLANFHRYVGHDPELPTTLEPRTRQMALPLLAMVDDPALADRIAVALARWDDGVRAERAQTLEAALLAALVAVFEASVTRAAPLAEVAARLNAAKGHERSSPFTAKTVGHLLRTRLRLTTQKSRGVYVIPPHERARAEALAVRFNVRADHGASPP